MSRHKEYEDYLKSEHWSNLRRAALNSANHLCEACGLGGDAMDGHHLKYRNPLDSCVLDDIMCLCRKCHESLHQWMRESNTPHNSLNRHETRGAIVVARFYQKPKSKKAEKNPKKTNTPRVPCRVVVKTNTTSAQIRSAIRSDDRFMLSIESLYHKYDSREFKRRYRTAINLLAKLHPCPARVKANAHMVVQQFIKDKQKEKTSKNREINGTTARSIN